MASQEVRAGKSWPPRAGPVLPVQRLARNARPSPGPAISSMMPSRATTLTGTSHFARIVDVYDVAHLVFSENACVHAGRDEIVPNRARRYSPTEGRHAQVPGPIVLLALPPRPLVRHSVQRRKRAVNLDHLPLGPPNFHGFRPMNVTAVHCGFYEHFLAPPRAAGITGKANFSSHPRKDALGD